MQNAPFTQYHSHYIAHRITLEGRDDEEFAKSLSTARVDMNPHQVDAALFAHKAPLAAGVMLADEVGLGNTMHDTGHERGWTIRVQIVRHIGL